MTQMQKSRPKVQMSTILKMDRLVAELERRFARNQAQLKVLTNADISEASKRIGQTPTPHLFKSLIETSRRNTYDLSAWPDARRRLVEDVEGTGDDLVEVEPVKETRASSSSTLTDADWVDATPQTRNLHSSFLEDHEVVARQKETFESLDDIAWLVAFGHLRSVIVSGPPGIGKTWGITQVMQLAHDQGELSYVFASVRMSAVGLYIALYNSREKNKVIVLDDVDVFDDVDTLQVLKAATDTSERRTISWNTNTKIKDEAGNELPKSFDYEGRVIFITNTNLRAQIKAGNKAGRDIAKHLEAVMSRAGYVDLNSCFRNSRDKMLWVLDRIAGSVGEGVPSSVKEKVTNYIRENHDNLDEISVRKGVQLIQLLTRVGEDNYNKFCKVAKTLYWKEQE